jgi:hypothetical protein
MCETVKDLLDAFNHACYIRNTDFEGGEVYVCNLCGETMLTISDVLKHLALFHANDTIPDVDPTEV